MRQTNNSEQEERHGKGNVDEKPAVQPVVEPFLHRELAPFIADRDELVHDVVESRRENGPEVTKHGLRFARELLHPEYAPFSGRVSRATGRRV